MLRKESNGMILNVQITTEKADNEKETKTKRTKTMKKKDRYQPNYTNNNFKYTN